RPRSHLSWPRPAPASVSISISQRVAAFVKRLRELAWVDGRNLAIEYRWAEGRPERVSEIAAEFVRIRAGEPWRCQRPGEVTEPVDRRQTVLRWLFENGGGDAEHESGTPTPQMPIFRAHVRCALRPGACATHWRAAHVNWFTRPGAA